MKQVNIQITKFHIHFKTKKYTKKGAVTDKEVSA